MARHLESKHGDEVLVARALSFPKKSVDRKRLLDDLRKRGDFQRNKNVVANGNGNLIPVRRPPASADPSNNLPCSFCFGLYKRHCLWKHQKSCPRKKRVSDDSW